MINYTTYTAQISNLMVISSTTPDFQTMLPGMIDYAEQRLYRELNPLRVQVTDSTTTVSSGNRNFAVPSATGTFIIIDNINIITPSSLNATNGSRVQLTPVSREFLDISYPSGQTVTDVPQFWAMASDTEILLGPAPDLPYTAEVIGIQRPTPLSSANSSTFLTQYCPDLFIAASMVFASGYMRDFGQQADNPQMGAAWEAQYKQLFGSAAIEQLRAKYQSENYTSEPPNPLAQKRM
jgi:hypothetical protein